MTPQTVELIRRAVEHLREEQYEELKAVLGVLDERIRQEAALGGAQPAGEQPQAKSEGVAARVLKQLEGWLQNARTLRSSTVGRSPAAQVRELLAEVKALTLPVTSSLRQPYRTGIVDLTYERPLGVLPLLTTIPVQTDVAEYVVATLPVNAATPVAEGAAKPEITTHTFELKQTTIRTIAAWIAASRQALEDTPQLESLINAYLLYQLGHQLEHQVINGNGTGQNFTGILNTTGIFTLTVPNTDPVRANLEALRKIRVNIEDLGATVNAIVLNPSDAAQIELLKDDNGQYYYGGPVRDGISTIWGVRTVVSAVVPGGKAIVGDWRYAVLFDRQAGSIAISDQHADYFVKNMIAILAELRAGFAVIRPQAFGVVNFRAW